MDATSVAGTALWMLRESFTGTLNLAAPKNTDFSPPLALAAAVSAVSITSS